MRVDLRIFVCVCYRVNGFDHRELDVEQQDWASHMYPYKIASYEYRALSEAATVAVIDFADAEALGFGAMQTAVLSIIQDGSCDAVAVWVDYELAPAGNFLRTYADGAFAYHQTVNIKFFDAPQRVEAGGNTAVQCSAVLLEERCDYHYDFSVVSM
jgi:hypothetical protein